MVSSVAGILEGFFWGLRVRILGFWGWRDEGDNEGGARRMINDRVSGGFT